MSLTDGKSWWEENQGRARRLGAICSLIAFTVTVILFHSDIKEFFSAHSWWEDALVALAGITMPVLAYFELRHSGEANQLRREANDFRAAANRLQSRVAELEEEKTGHLAQIAANTQRPVSQAERRAAILRQRLGTTVAVVEVNGVGAWGASPEIVEVSDDNVVALFLPYGPLSGAARCVHVYCDDLEITELPNGSLQLKVLKRYGSIVNLGQITEWEDRLKPAAAAPVFDKGDTISMAYFEKIGTSEKRNLFIFTSKNDVNSFIFEASTGVRYFGNNVDISIRFMAMQVECLEAGFTRKNFRPGDGKYRLHVW